MSFVQALAFVERQEGGWADDPNDAGGLTRFGIASRSHPNVDLAALTRERAAEIFRQEYWAPAHCESFSAPIDLAVFDYAIHSGVRRAVKALQASIGAGQDGMWGPTSKRALESAVLIRGPKAVAMGVVYRRKVFMVRNFRKGLFSPKDPRRFLGGFWKRTLDLAFEIGRTKE